MEEMIFMEEITSIEEGNSEMNKKRRKVRGKRLKWQKES